MRGKLMFLGGAAIGFVLGARAGREQYDRLAAAGRQLWEHPTVQEAAGVVQAQANRVYSEGKDAVTGKLNNGKLGERRHGREQAESGAMGKSSQMDDPLAATRSQSSPGI